MAEIHIHRVLRTEVHPIVHYPPDYSTEAFWTRKYVFTDNKDLTEITLLANTPDALYLPGEIYPEREIDAQAKAGEPEPAMPNLPASMECNEKADELPF